MRPKSEKRIGKKNGACTAIMIATNPYQIAVKRNIPKISLGFECVATTISSPPLGKGVIVMCDAADGTHEDAEVGGTANSRGACACSPVERTGNWKSAA